MPIQICLAFAPEVHQPYGQQGAKRFSGATQRTFQQPIDQQTRWMARVSLLVGMGN
jgi:hypothetical protein